VSALTENIKLEIKKLSGNNSDFNKYVVFNDVSFIIPKNKITTLFAPMGSGKSTLLKLIMSQNNLNIKYYGNRIFYIPSEIVLIDGFTVAENIKLYVSSHCEDKINDALKIVGLDGYKNHIPINRSKGFIFRVMLAIGLIIKSDLIIIDDYFNNMRNITKIEIFNLLIELKNKMNLTFFISSSNFSNSLTISDKIIFAKGNPFEVLYDIDIELNYQNLELKLESEQFSLLKDRLTKKLSELRIRDIII